MLFDKSLNRFLATGAAPSRLRGGIALDETLAEHDAKYHPGGYKGGFCSFRANIAAKRRRESHQTKFNFSPKTMSESDKQKAYAEYLEKCRSWVRHAPEQGEFSLESVKEKWCDGTHPDLEKIWQSEVSRRFSSYFDDLGERA